MAPSPGQWCCLRLVLSGEGRSAERGVEHAGVSSTTSRNTSKTRLPQALWGTLAGNCPTPTMPASALAQPATLKLCSLVLTQPK